MKRQFWEWVLGVARRQRRKYLTQDELEALKKMRQHNFRKNNMTVTQHALLRYFERIEGYDMDKVMNILTKDLKPNNEGFHTTTGVRVLVQGGTVVTVLPMQSNTTTVRKSDIGNRIKGMEGLHERERETRITENENA